eukprot:RCo037898
MRPHRICLQLRMRNLRDFIVWLVDFFGWKEKSEHQKLYEAFALNSTQGPAIHFCGCTCPICLDVVADDIFVSPCLHVFHFDCVRAWLDGQSRSTCPVCRAEISTFIWRTRNPARWSR